MPETLAEVDSFDTDIVVPSGDDWMDNAAEVVAAAAAKLTNRTRYLNLRSAKLTEDNTWTGINLFQKLLRAKAVNTVSPVSSFERAATAATHWQHLSTFDVGGGNSARVYSNPAGASIGAFAITFNATWAEPANWTRIDPTQKAIALIWRHNDVRLCAMPADPSLNTAWAAWPQNTIGAFGATMLSELFRAARMEVTANTNADSSNGYRYTGGVVFRTSCIPLGSIWGNVMVNPDGSIGRSFSGFDALHDALWIPIRIPPFCAFEAFRVRFAQLQTPGQPDQWQLKKRTGTGGWTDINPDGSPGANIETWTTYGDTTATLHGGGASIIVKDNEEYAYRWKVVSGDPASSGNKIIGVELGWSDIGPNNRAG